MSVILFLIQSSDPSVPMSRKRSAGDFMKQWLTKKPVNTPNDDHDDDVNQSATNTHHVSGTSSQPQATVQVDIIMTPNTSEMVSSQQSVQVHRKSSELCHGLSCQQAYT